MPSGSDPTVSTSDLAIQLSRGSVPTFVLVCVCENLAELHVQRWRKIADAISRQTGSPTEIVYLVQRCNRLPDGDTLILREHQANDNNNGFSFFSNDVQVPYHILLRPDGHVASVEPMSSQDVESMADNLCEGVPFRLTR